MYIWCGRRSGWIYSACNSAYAFKCVILINHNKLINFETLLHNFALYFMQPVDTEKIRKVVDKALAQASENLVQLEHIHKVKVHLYCI